MVMPGILSLKSRTIREIAKQLDIPIWYLDWYTPPQTDTLIRWGSTALGPVASRTINTAEAISKASNKAQCRSLLAEAGVPVPHSGIDKFPCIGRRAKHKEGRAFWVCRNEQDVQRAMRQGAVYFSEVYPKTNEYRVHIANGKCILFSIKEGRKEGRICWSHHKTGFKLLHVRRGERRKDIIDLAKRATKVIGLDFCAVDILADPDQEGYEPAVVCEINCAPGLSPMGVRKYVKYFKRVLGESIIGKTHAWQRYTKPLMSHWAEQMQSLL